MKLKRKSRPVEREVTPDLVTQEAARIEREELGPPQKVNLPTQIHSIALLDSQGNVVVTSSISPVTLHLGDTIRLQDMEITLS